MHRGFQSRLSTPVQKIYHHALAAEGAHSWTMARDTENNARIARILEDLDVTFVREMTIAGLRGFRTQKGRVRFDFYVPPTPKHPQMFIEYDGLQHYGSGYGRLPGYTNQLYHEYENKLQVMNDLRKTMYCHQAGIPLLRIPPGLSPDTEHNLIKSSLQYWQQVRERSAMGAEDTWSQERLGNSVKVEIFANPDSLEAHCLKRARTEFENHEIPTAAPVYPVPGKREKKRKQEEDVIDLNVTDLESATDLESVE